VDPLDELVEHPPEGIGLIGNPQVSPRLALPVVTMAVRLQEVERSVANAADETAHVSGRVIMVHQQRAVVVVLVLTLTELAVSGRLHRQ